MKYKQNIIDLLEEIKDEVLNSNAQQEEKDVIVGLIYKAKDYFDDYAFEVTENIEGIKDKFNEILSSELYSIERMTED